MLSICFICLGNICRSPMAEAIFRHEIKERGLEDQVQVDSHATSNWNEGQPPHHGTQKILNQVGISSEGQTSTVLTKENSQDYDYLIAMDDSNISNIRQIIGDQASVYQLLDFTGQSGEIPDPYFTGDFDETYDLVSKGIAGLLTFLEEKHDLA